MCSNTYGDRLARGWSGTRTMTYPALWTVRPPFQFPFASFATVRHIEHCSDFACFGRPQAHVVLARHAGHRRCLLEGANRRPHSAHVLKSGDFQGMYDAFRRLLAGTLRRGCDRQRGATAAPECPDSDCYDPARMTASALML